eukprot:TRINITY_DN4900_c0_g1_i4.p1 TRINITY_DN4900_c0_g1~~TRINITY_DN4900_c0_g1_i4.p1  ORF type:complete len:361 (-),score=-5.95 TRINITY_DN4900_c0_g1_i4:445-1527(-)
METIKRSTLELDLRTFTEFSRIHTPRAQIEEVKKSLSSNKSVTSLVQQQIRNLCHGFNAWENNQFFFFLIIDSLAQFEKTFKLKPKVGLNTKGLNSRNFPNTLLKFICYQLIQILFNSNFCQFNFFFEFSSPKVRISMRIPTRYKFEYSLIKIFPGAYPKEFELLRIDCTSILIEIYIVVFLFIQLFFQPQFLFSQRCHFYVAKFIDLYLKKFDLANLRTIYGKYCTLKKIITIVTIYHFIITVQQLKHQNRLQYLQFLTTNIVNNYLLFLSSVVYYFLNCKQVPLKLRIYFDNLQNHPIIRFQQFCPHYSILNFFIQILECQFIVEIKTSLILSSMVKFYLIWSHLFQHKLSKINFNYC